MDTSFLPEELERASERFETEQDRVVKSEGYGSHAYSLAVIQHVIEQFTGDLTKRIANPDTRYYGDREALAVIRTELEPEVVALAILHSTLGSYAMGADYRRTALAIGSGIHSEVWAAGIRKITSERKDREGNEFTVNLARDIENFVRRKHGNTKVRLRSARTLAKRQGYNGINWSHEQRLRVGHWGLSCLLALLPDVFMLETGRRQVQNVVLTPEADAKAVEWVAAIWGRDPVWQPRFEAPLPWTGLHSGGVDDVRLAPSCNLVRARHAQRPRWTAVSNVIRDGGMDTVLRAVNALQAVPWSINQRVLGVARECLARGLHVEGLPQKPGDARALPSAEWDLLGDLEKKRHTKTREQTKQAERRYRCDLTRLLGDFHTAEAMSERNFYVAMNLDWRGRVYPMPHFNYQRSGLVRSLFLFGEGQPITDEGTYWLKAHVAAMGEFEGVHKKPFSERVQWVDDNLEMIRSTAHTPLADTRWHSAGEPWLFLAACQEFVSCVEGTSRVVRIPVAYDASASGLQHLCAMTRSEEGALVNLTPSPLPRDAYQVVADRVLAKLKADTEPLAATWLTYLASPGAESPRSIVKRNVMTYAYSSKVYGMSQQHREDLMRPLTMEVILGERAEHPFGPDDGYSAAKYIARLVYSSIEEVVTKPAEAMTFLQKLAKALAHEGKPLRWTTPCGLPWINAYHEPITKRVNLWLYDKGVRVEHRVKLTTGEKREIAKAKVANAVAPNVVHALDASHLLLTVVASVNAGITNLATVHDSFGCLPNDAGRYRRIIREEFVRMYETFDPLRGIWDQALADVDDKTRVTDIALPQRGGLDITEVLKSDFAFH